MSHHAPTFHLKKRGVLRKPSMLDQQQNVDPFTMRLLTIGRIMFQKQHQQLQEDTTESTCTETANIDAIDLDEARVATTRMDVIVDDQECNHHFVRLNVGGQRFMLRKSTIRMRGIGLLLRLIDQETNADAPADAFLKKTSEFYFERPPALFNIVYQFYITGKIHQPSHLCPVDIIEELEFWQLASQDHLASCCCAAAAEECEESEAEEEIEKPNLFKTLKFGEIRRCVWDIIEEPASSSKAQIFAVLSVLFVLISISGLVLGSLPELQTPVYINDTTTGTAIVEMEPVAILGHIEYLCIVWFTMEYGLKMLVTAERKKTFTQLLNIIDLFAILPFLIEVLLWLFGVSTQQLRDLKGAFLVIRILRVLRVIRVLKLGRYSSGLQMFGRTLAASFRQLGMMAMVVMTGVIFFSTLVYFLEKDEPDSKFNSIPAACWWCIVTMTTVGYGDLTPTTVLGKLVATGAIACGVLVLALPITIIVDNFMKVAECDRPKMATRYHGSRWAQRAPSDDQSFRKESA